MTATMFRLSALALLGTVGCSRDDSSSKEATGTTTAETVDSAGTGGSGGEDTSDSGPDTADSGGGETDPRSALALPESGHVSNRLVATPDVCAECHSNAGGATAMRTSDGTGIAPYNLQHGTMMANAGRDPLFWAVLSAETAGAPDLTAEVEGTCLRCHGPMAVAQAGGDELDPVAELRVADTTEGRLLRDGVSCTTCHRFEPDTLGAPETWSGHWQYESTNAMYGPHADPFTNPMEHHTSFSPTEGTHMLTGELCASCHTLQTPTVVDGAASGHTFLEQATYLEWRNSTFGPDGATPGACQTCHFPTTEADGSDIVTRIARNPAGSDFSIDPRSPFGQHFQVGGNAYMLGVIRDNADILNPRADTGTFDAVIARTRSMLQTAASIELVDPIHTDGNLSFTVAVQNLTGHKLPTGYPARRAWLQVVVTDSAGTEVFASGGTDDRGRILGADGAVLASEAAGGPVQDHRTTIASADDVVVYQSLMANPDGTPVFRLLQAAQMHKDNRLLPAGWATDTTATEVGDLAPVGVDGDADFVAGGDGVQVALSGLGGTAPYTVTVGLAYQSVSPRYIDELALVDTPEVQAFLVMAERSDPRPEVIATASVEVP